MSSSSDERESESAQADPDYNPSNESDDGDSDGVNFLDVLRRILSGRSGLQQLHTISTTGGLGQQIQLRLRQVDDDIGTDSDSDDYYHQYDPRRQLHERTPKPPDEPDTSIIDQSELRQQMLYEQGGVSGATCRRRGINPSYTLKQLMMKEIGLLGSRGSQNVSNGWKAATSHPYIINRYDARLLMRLRDKFFCGIHDKAGTMFMSASQDAQVRIYDARPGRWTKIKAIPCRDVGWSILDIDFSHGGNHIVYSSWSEHIHLCNIRGDSEVHDALYLAPDETYRTAVFSLKFNPDDSEILAGANEGYIYIYNRERNERFMKIDAHEDDLSSVAFADNSGQIFYSGGDDGVVKVWDRRNLIEDNPIPVGQLSGHYDSIVHIDSRNDARYLLTNSKDQSIKLWDIRKFANSEGVTATRTAVSKQNWDYRWHGFSGRIVKKKLPGDCSLMTYYGHSVIRTLIRARFSPAHSTGHRFIYSGDGLGRVLVYDVLSGKLVQKLEPGPDPKAGIAHKRDVVRDVSWHPYDNTLISSGWDGRLIQWQYGTPEEEEPLEMEESSSLY